MVPEGTIFCPFGPSEYRHLERSPCMRQGITPQRHKSCTKKGAKQARYEIGTITAQYGLFPNLNANNDFEHTTKPPQKA